MPICVCAFQSNLISSYVCTTEPNTSHKTFLLNRRENSAVVFTPQHHSLFLWLASKNQSVNIAFIQRWGYHLIFTFSLIHNARSNAYGYAKALYVIFLNVVRCSNVSHLSTGQCVLVPAAHCIHIVSSSNSQAPSFTFSNEDMKHHKSNCYRNEFAQNIKYCKYSTGFVWIYILICPSTLQIDYNKQCIQIVDFNTTSNTSLYWIPNLKVKNSK